MSKIQLKNRVRKTVNKILKIISTKNLYFLELRLLLEQQLFQKINSSVRVSNLPEYERLLLLLLLLLLLFLSSSSH